MFLLFSPQVRDSQHQRLLLCAQPGQAGLGDGGGGVARGGDNHEGLDLGGHARGGVKVKNAKKYFVFLKKVFCGVPWYLGPASYWGPLTHLDF